MVRWWHVNDVTPSGLRLNTAWKLRQFLFALVPGALTWVVLHNVSTWEHKQAVESESVFTIAKKNLFAQIPQQYFAKLESVNTDRDRMRENVHIVYNLMRTNCRLDENFIAKSNPIILAILLAASYSVSEPTIQDNEEAKQDAPAFKAYFLNLALRGIENMSSQTEQNPVLDALKAALKENLNLPKETAQIDVKTMPSTDTVQEPISAMRKRRNENRQSHRETE